MSGVSYKDQAYNIIKDKIIKLELKPGERVSKKELVASLKIGDTPIRDAIQQLNREGLLEIRPQSGTLVSKIDMQKVIEAKFVRSELEAAIFLEVMETITSDQIKELEEMIAIQEIQSKNIDSDSFFESDEKFHKFFYQVADKMNVYNWLLIINVHLNRYRHLTLEVKELNWQRIITQHKQIIEALKNKDRSLLLKLISAHLRLVDEDFQFVIKEFPAYFEK